MYSEILVDDSYDLEKQMFWCLAIIGEAILSIYWQLNVTAMLHVDGIEPRTRRMS